MTMIMIKIGPTTETDLTLEKAHMTETIHTVKTNHMNTTKQIDMCMTEMIRIVEIEHMTEINHAIEIEHTKEIGHTAETECITETDCSRDRSYSRDRSWDYHRDDYTHDYKNYYINDYRNEYRKENHRDFKDQRYMRKHKDYYEDIYEDRYNKDDIELATKTKIGINIDTSTEMTAMTKLEVDLEKDVAYLRKGKLTTSTKIDQVHKVIWQLSQDKQISLRLILDNSEDVEAMFFSIYSEADVDHLIAEKISYATNQASYEPVKFNACLVQNFENSESLDIDTCLTQNYDLCWAQDSHKFTEIIDVIKVPNETEVKTEIENIDECKIVDLQSELDLWEPKQTPDTPIILVEGQILEEFMLEEDIEFQGIDKCKIVELQDEQEIERCVASETVGLPEMPVRIACEQEECIEEEICDMSLPEMYSIEESIHTDRLKLETPIKMK